MEDIEERYKKTDDIISKFKNGRERFNKSALFNKCVQSLVRGTDPYELIDQLIMCTEDIQNAFEQHIIRGGPTPIIIDSKTLNKEV